MSILKNYAFSIFLILCILIGGICGIIFRTDTEIVKPIGDLFLNLMFVLIVPLVFLSVSSAIYNMKQLNVVGKVVKNIVFVFLGTAVITATIAYIVIAVYQPFNGIDPQAILSTLPPQQDFTNKSVGEILVNSVSVNEFMDLFKKSNLLPLIIFSIMLGVAATHTGKAGEHVAELLNAGNKIIMQMMHIIMYGAPIGLGCYFAYTIGQLGQNIIDGYVQAFIVYIILTIILYFGLNSIYMLLSGGKQAFYIFWRNLFTPSITAIGTSSSAACIPVNIEACRRMNVPNNIAETVIPLGTNLHKDGSIVAGVVKIIFLFSLFGHSTNSAMNIFVILGVAILVGCVMGAIPSGGMTGELLICSIFGFSPELVGTLMIISTILDIPATLLNSTGNITSSVLVTRLTLGKKWMNRIEPTNR